MANANIFQQYLQPARSAMDYRADMDRAEAMALDLEGRRRQNEIQALTAQQTRGALADAAAKRNAIQAVYSSLPPTAQPLDRARALQRNPLTAAEGIAAEKAINDAAHVEAQTGDLKAKTAKSDWETRIAKRDAAISEITAFQSPQQAAESIQRHTQEGNLSPEQAQVLLQRLSQARDPGQFAMFQRDLVRSIMAATKREELAVQERGQDMTAATAAEGRKTQLKIAGMADARAREGNEIQRGLVRQKTELENEALRDKANERQRGRDAAVSSTASQIAVIDKALSHPGRKTATGLSGTIDPRNYVPGTDATDFRAVLDQIGGAAFLQAFESLKGGGAITEVEGKKATDAIARLSRAQSDEEFQTSLSDLRDVMTEGYRRLSGKDYSRPSPVKPKASGAWTVKEVK